MSAAIRTSAGRPRWAAGLAVVGLVVAGFYLNVEAATPVESGAQLDELCELSSPELDDGRDIDPRTYHERRRRAIQRTYETTVSELGPGAMNYDRVGALLTITGLGTYRPFGTAPALRFRNRTAVKFEFDEHQAHDLMAQLRMGTVEVRLGFAPVARERYDLSFCEEVDGHEGRRLDVDLLYARLVDTERNEADGGAVLATYQTPRGYRWMLQREFRLAADGQGTPDVRVTDLQWRPADGDWESGFEDGPPDSIEQLHPELEEAVEQSIYPCYVRGLTANASLQGAVVVQIPVRQPEPAEASFLMDTIQLEGMRQCIRERLGEIDELGRAAGIEAVEALKATVLMRRK